MNQTKIVKEQIAKIFEKNFLKEIHYEGNDLAVVTKLGGIDRNIMTELTKQGFPIRYMNPCVINGRNGLSISLEVA